VHDSEVGEEESESVAEHKRARDESAPIEIDGDDQVRGYEIERGETREHGREESSTRATVSAADPLSPPRTDEEWHDVEENGNVRADDETTLRG
jgi:cobyric acid synthase